MKHLLKVYNLSSKNMCEKLVGWKSLVQEINKGPNRRRGIKKL